MARLPVSPHSYVHRVLIAASNKTTASSNGEQREIEIRDSEQCTLLMLMDRVLALLQLGRGGVEELSWPPADTDALAFVLTSVVPSYDSTTS